MEGWNKFVLIMIAAPAANTREIKKKIVLHQRAQLA